MTRSGHWDSSVRAGHLAAAAVGLFLLATFTYLRRPLLLALGLVSLILGSIGAGAHLWGTTGLLGLALPFAGELLLQKSSGSPWLWPPILAIGLTCAGAAGAAVHLSVNSDLAGLLPIAMLITSPWGAVVSRLYLAYRRAQTVGRGGSEMSEIAVTRALAGDVTELVGSMARAVSPFEPGNQLECLPAITDRLAGFDEAVPSLSQDELERARATLLTVRGLLGAGLTQEAAEALIVLPAGPGAGDRTAMEAESCPATTPSVAVRHAVALIYAYRRIVPQDRRRGCRFHPSCSQYVEDALLHWGLLKGLGLGLGRALRCVPFGDAGRDPVPYRIGKHSRGG